MASRRVQSAEVLTRWTHPVLGPVPVLEFIQVAEQTGSSGLLLRWVLGAALDQLRSWRAEGFALDLAVNLSAADVGDPALPDDVLAALAARRLPADALILEITESAFMHEVERATANVERLRVPGVRFSIDDFGTGYSSLAQLRRLPVDELKIDRSFVADAASDPDDAAVVRLIVELGRSLGLRVVAEGVETEASWRLLNELGCDCAQGYLVSRPLPAAEFARRARELNAELPFDPTQTAVIHRLQRPSRSGL
jgi:EAL domain-containing protein (putative c-di-GMP-specific phosphodiesterase class I)